MQIVKLNLARNCIKYLIRLYGIKEIFVPYYTCKTVWQTIREENCKIKFYHIDSNFMPAVEFSRDDFIIYTNYYGLCDKNCEILAEKYPRLILDNTHAFYSSVKGFAMFNSLRKFFPVQNGAYLFCNNILNEKFSVDDLNLEPVSPQEDYEKFCKNEETLNMQDIKLISPSVEKIMKNIDFENDKNLRREIYNKYCEKFDKINKIHRILQDGEIPYCYPFSPVDIKYKNELLLKKITLIKLWSELPDNYPECAMLSDVAALPLNGYYKDILI